MGSYYAGIVNSPWSQELRHYGVKGTKWGVRNYQNEDGSLTDLGRQHYGVGEAKDDSSTNSGDVASSIKSAYSKVQSETHKELDYISFKLKSGAWDSETAKQALENAIELDKERVEYRKKKAEAEQKKKETAEKKAQKEAEKAAKEAAKAAAGTTTSTKKSSTSSTSTAAATTSGKQRQTPEQRAQALKNIQKMYQNNWLEYKSQLENENKRRKARTMRGV